jgi:EAL domain-containing protein (putative c-di-GMP-specific phosphodiesterase class I)
LLRWTSPSLGAVPPGKFIPIAEESDLIEKIGTWVLYEACRQAKRWRDAGLPAIVVSLNVSARQLRDPKLPEVIVHALHDAQLDPGSIEVELTESTIMQDVERMIERVQRMRELGIRLAIDDFGTGYSSLAHLSRFPADRLKVDQSFVRHLTRPDITAIVQTVISLGHALKLSVIAEGVETQEQARILKDWGCEELQGYFFGRPMPADALAAKLANGAGRAQLV